MSAEIAAMIVYVATGMFVLGAVYGEEGRLNLAEVVVLGVLWPVTLLALVCLAGYSAVAAHWVRRANQKKVTP